MESSRNIYERTSESKMMLEFSYWTNHISNFDTHNQKYGVVAVLPQRHIFLCGQHLWPIMWQTISPPLYLTEYILKSTPQNVK